MAAEEDVVNGIPAQVQKVEKEVVPVAKPAEVVKEVAQPGIIVK